MINQDFLETLKTKSGSNKNIISVAVLIVVLLIGGFFVFKNKVGTEPPNQSENVPKTVVTPEVVRIPEDRLQKELPVDFPKEMLFNGKIRTIESYGEGYAQNPNIKQATTKFNSSKSMQENYDFYLKWAKDNKWEITNSPIQDNLASLYGQKNQAILNIVITPKISGKIKSEVNITYGEM